MAWCVPGCVPGCVPAVCVCARVTVQPYRALCFATARCSRCAHAPAPQRRLYAGYTVHEQSASDRRVYVDHTAIIAPSPCTAHRPATKRLSHVAGLMDAAPAHRCGLGLHLCVGDNDVLPAFPPHIHAAQSCEGAEMERRDRKVERGPLARSAPPRSTVRAVICSFARTGH